MDQPTSNIAFDRSEGHLLVRLGGELDADTGPLLTEQVTRELTPDDRDVRLDLSEVTFCGSAGVRMLVQVQHEVSTAGGTVAVENPAPIVRRVLDLCGIGDVMTVR